MFNTFNPFAVYPLEWFATGLQQGSPTFGRLWATLEEEELSWATR